MLRRPADLLSASIHLRAIASPAKPSINLRRPVAVLIHVNRIFLVRALLRPRTRASEGYLIAVAAVTAAYLARLALGPVLGGHAPFLLFVLPVVGSVIYGGRSAGLVAGALSLIGGYSFVEPQDRWSAMVTIQAALFVPFAAQSAGSAPNWLISNRFHSIGARGGGRGEPRRCRR
jgi:hypothetical protein